MRRVGEVALNVLFRVLGLGLGFGVKGLGLRVWVRSLGWPQGKQRPYGIACRSVYGSSTAGLFKKSMKVPHGTGYGPQAPALSKR